jgi:hypothetical protein
MTIRTRKFFGTVALLVLVVVWSLLGMTYRPDAVAGQFRPAAGGLLCGGGARVGAAGDADHQLDVAARTALPRPSCPGSA